MSEININNILNGKIPYNIREFNHTLKPSLSISGVACVGKSTILNEIDHKIKSGRRGKIINKKDSIFLSMITQTSSFIDSISYPNNISDRSFVDNFIWRIIMSVIGLPIEDQLKYIKIFLDALSDDINFENSNIIFILEDNYNENRERMIKRATNGDLFRGRILDYVLTQNLVYYLFALKTKINFIPKSKINLIKLNNDSPSNINNFIVDPEKINNVLYYEKKDKPLIEFFDLNK